MTKGSLGDITSLHFTTILNVQHARSHERVAIVLLRTTKYWILLQFWAPRPQEVTKGSLGDIKSLHFTTILNVQHARSHERVAMVSRRIRVLPQFWASDTSEVTKRFGSATSKICILPQFWASDTSEVTKGSIGDVKNLRFTTVLSVQHVRSDERVDPRAQKFAFYHSFERPTRPKWRKGRSASSEICILPQFLSVRHARTDERVVKSTGAIPAPQTEKEYILTLFQTILISSISLQSFL